MDITGTGRSSQQAYFVRANSQRSEAFHFTMVPWSSMVVCHPGLASPCLNCWAPKRCTNCWLCLWVRHHTAGCERGRQWRKALALLFDMDLFSIEKDWVKSSVHGRMFLLTFWWRTAPTFPQKIPTFLQKIPGSCDILEVTETKIMDHNGYWFLRTPKEIETWFILIYHDS